MNFAVLSRTVLAAGLFVLGGCAASAPAHSCTEPNGIPQNYDEEYSLRNLVLVCSFQNQIPEEGLAKVAPDLSTFLQAELGRIRRFTVYCLWNDGTYRLASELANQGELEAQAVGPPVEVDLYLSGVITASKGMNTMTSGNSEHSYLVDAAIELQSAKRMQLWGRNYTGGRVKRTTTLNTRGEPIGGHDPNDGEDVRHALKESARVLLHRVVNQLGSEYPVTGNVTGISGNKLAFDRGAEQGVMGETTVVVWDKQQGGIDVAIGYGCGTAARNRMTVDIHEWYTSDPSAKGTIDAIQADPKWIEANPARLYATTLGLGTPPEWDEASRQAERMGKYDE